MSFFNEILPYYVSAKRTMLIAHDNLTQKWYHVFSVIELLPDEITKYRIPSGEWYENKMIRSALSSKRSAFTFYLLVEDISPTEAQSIFSNPVQNNKMDRDSSLWFFNSEFIREPTGSLPLVFSSNLYATDGIASVIPKRKSGFYLWTQIDKERKVQNLFSSKEDQDAISALTKDWLGFDISIQPEHLGNVYLVAPNPYLRDLDVSLSMNPIGIFYKLKLRKGIQEAFRIRIVDTHGDIVALDKTYPVENSLGLIELPHEPHLVEFRMYNASEDLIAVYEPATFVKNINFGISSKRADFHVKIQDGGGVKEFVVEKYSHELSSSAGKETDFNSAYYFKTAQKSRKHISLEKNNEFVFFPGGKSDGERADLKYKAKESIMRIINQAKETCFLCDPYFNVNDLIEFAFRIRSTSAAIRIINAKEYLTAAKAKSLYEAIAEYNKKPFQKIECRSLRGKSILHDRFITADRNVWYLGSSFSEFGKRATCIGKVPESSDREIVKEIERWFYSNELTQSLEDYIANG